MSRLAALLFTVSQIHALKLLVNYDGNEDWEWETDIQFSFKPFSGKCQKDDGDLTFVRKSDSGYGENTRLSELVCDKGVVGDKDYAKYCDAPEIVTKANAKFESIAKKWTDVLVAAKEFKKCPHYYAKLATMSNAEMTKEGNDVLIKSFDVVMTDCEVVFYKEDATTSKADANKYCYSTTETTWAKNDLGIAWAKNDPKVKNIHGEEFDILSTGTFKMLDVTQASNSLLNVEATIDRAGSQCGATYIQNVTIRGAWVEEAEVNHIQVRAKAAVPKHRALEINVNDTWMAASRLAQSSDLTDGLAFAVPYASSGKLDIVLHQVRFAFSIDSHRIHETTADSRLAHRFANFLNMQIDGIHNIEGSRIGGILGTDDHDSVTQMPEDCDKNLQLMLKEGPDSLSHVTLI